MLPTVTPKQWTDALRIAGESYGVDPLMWMESAGRALAARARFMLAGDAGGEPVVVMAGASNHGGAALAAARHLHNAGAEVAVLLAGASDELPEPARRQWEALDRLSVPQLLYYVPGARLRLAEAAVVVDAVRGPVADADPEDAEAAMILAINETRKPALALDVPSGFLAEAGRPSKYCVKARSTLALGLPKVGLYGPEAAGWVGELYLADVGIPAGAWEEAGVKPEAWFRRSDLLRLPAPGK